MPYELAFARALPPIDREQYINECCVGGDVVVERLLPSIRARYTHLDSNQEDWGWFIWFRDGEVRLAIDVHTDDAERGAFRLHLTSRRRRWLWFDTVVDTPELEMLRQLVESQLAEWPGGAPSVTRLNEKYM
jgi:hypothetical protein